MPCENLTLVRRLRLSLPFLSLFAVLALSGCRTEPSVAAYVEDVTISTDELAAAVEERLADENIAAVIAPGDADYQRVVLDQLVQKAIYEIISADYDVQISDRAVEARLDELLSGDVEDAEATYARIAAEQSLAQIDVVQEVRRILTREAIAAEEEVDGPIQEPALLQRYEEIRDQLTTIELGFITVPDQDTADTLLEGLLADPSSYPALAATYAGPNTAPALVSGPSAEVPGPLMPSVAQTPAGQGFTVAVPEVGIVVGFVASLEVTPFEEVRDQLRSEAFGGVNAAALEIVAGIASGLDIDINPRYGSFDQGQVVPEVGGGVVQILEDAGTP